MLEISWTEEVRSFVFAGLGFPSDRDCEIVCQPIDGMRPNNSLEVSREASWSVSWGFVDGVMGETFAE